MILWCRKLVSLFQYKNHTLLVYFCMRGIFSPHIYSHKPGSHLQLSEIMTWRENCFFLILMSMLLCWHFFVDSGNLALVWKCTKSMLVKLNLILRWLKTVSSTFQYVDFDGSLLPLFISWCYNPMVSKNCLITESLVNTLILFLWHNRLP